MQGVATRTATSTKTETKTQTFTSVTTSTVTTGLSSAPPPSMTVNGSSYYYDNVTADTTVGAPGYSYFHNSSVTFLGIQFTTYCPPVDIGCPSTSSTSIATYTTISLGIISMSVHFPDGTNETVSVVIGDSTYAFGFTHYSDLTAGILVTYSTNGHQSGYNVYLLVSTGPFALVFQQVAKCASIGYLAPWQVTLSNGESITAPPNGNISQGYASGSPTNPSTITFYVTNGNYTFSVSGAANSLTPATGEVTVDNGNVVIFLYQGGEPFSCGSTTTTTG